MKNRNLVQEEYKSSNPFFQSQYSKKEVKNKMSYNEGDFGKILDDVQQKMFK